MFAAAYRALTVGVLLSAAPVVPAAEAPPRATPSRPGTAPAPAASPPALTSRGAVGKPLPTRKFGRVEYLNAADAVGRLGLKLTLSDRGRKGLVTGPGARLEMEKDGREIAVNGLRLFLGEPVLEADGRLFLSRIDFERGLAPLLRPGYDGVAAPAPRTIVLDPGHGGKDNGTSAHEKTYALDVARRAQKLLQAAGHQVVLTRDRDVFLDLPQRGALANARGADVFASIHFNALPNDAKTSGIEIFTFAPQFQRSTNSWSPRETNDSELEAAPVNRHDGWSAVLAHHLQRRLVTDLKAFDRGKKLAHWGVLRGLNCPGVLIECGFLTSDVEARKIATPQYRQKLAEAIAAGIRDYAATTASPPTRNSAVAQRRRGSAG